jgi:hypothetical protein
MLFQKYKLPKQALHKKVEQLYGDKTCLYYQVLAGSMIFDDSTGEKEPTLVISRRTKFLHRR